MRKPLAEVNLTEMDRSHNTEEVEDFRAYGTCSFRNGLSLLVNRQLKGNVATCEWAHRDILGSFYLHVRR